MKFQKKKWSKFVKFSMLVASTTVLSATACNLLSPENDKDKKESPIIINKNPGKTQPSVLPPASEKYGSRPNEGENSNGSQNKEPTKPIPKNPNTSPTKPKQQMTPDKPKEPSKPINTNKQVENKFMFGNILKIQPNEVYFAKNLSQLEKDQALAAYNKTSVMDINEIPEKNDRGQWYLEYRDPFTNILFRDYSYHTNEDGSHRYMLGRHGLIDLAQEFKRKVPFGPEVFDLEAINVNNFNVIDEKANGLYIPNIKNIYINGSAFAEKNFNSYQIIGGIMPTLFHEYMHHWSNSYPEAVENGIQVSKSIAEPTSENQKRVTKIYYNPGLQLSDSSTNQTSGLVQSWDSYFANNFYKLLNYDVNQYGYLSEDDIAIFDPSRGLNFNIPPLEDEINNFLFKRLTPKKIWEIANNKPRPQELSRFEENTPLYYSPDRAFSLSLGNLRYVYSLTELLPREYTKYAYESYFQIDDENPTAKAAPGQATITWFGTTYYRNDPNTGKVYSVFSPSANAEDWSKVYLNNFDSKSRSGMFLRGDRPFDEENFPGLIVNSTIMPNSVFDISSYRYENDKYLGINFWGQPSYELRVHTLPPEKTQNRSQEFYDLFLNAMGYGKTINQIFYQSSWKWGQNKGSVDVDESKANKVKFTGFLPDKKYDGIVVTKPNGGGFEKTYFNYYDTFSFFGHKELDGGATLIKDEKITDRRQKQLENRIYPGTSSNGELNKDYVSYITKDYVNLYDNSQVFLWEDKNKDNQVQPDELNSSDISLPENRSVTNSRGWNIDEKVFRKYALKSENGKVLVKRVN
ncbi:hypothetical protein BCF59_0426 [Mycoplasmopsis mustelae]|uniref:Peptidase n=1 Tax=Mycoplasmopsis mustelae TaxID=171289 RepID=A0A4R7UFR7_9BACT|nr:hypothetical protein [Mycoplasmopsis mustelae]TDV24455.1 hypothetical protein BCF59_0426 [Mycoplasmopsis mustelae]